MSIIEFREVNKFFGDFQVLEDINFSVTENIKLAPVKVKGVSKKERPPRVASASWSG